MGIRLDYLSPTFYLTDLVWFFWLVSSVGVLKLNFKWESLLWLGLIVINVYGAVNKEVAIMGWVRWIQWWLTIWLIASQKVKIKEYLKLVLAFWLVLEGGLAIAQVAKNGSIQGIFWWLGERKFDYLTIGIAQIRWWGEGFIRAYGTFSHPNSMAGFLLVSLILWSSYKKEIKSYWWWLVTWIGLVGIVLNGSRIVWVLTVIWGILKILGKKWKGGMLIMFGLVLIIVGLLGGEGIGGWDKESWNKRVDLNKVAYEMIKTKPLFGVGVNNFMINLPKIGNSRWLQPVHNIPLLVTAEIGVWGSMLWIWWLMRRILRTKITRQVLMIGMVIVVTAMMDHYWITLPQNKWLLAIVIVWLLG